MQSAHTPPLGFAALTPFYDRVISAMTREKDWRGRLVECIDAKRGETILDVGSGTGSLAMAVLAAAPGCFVRGIDPDAEAVAIARNKAERAGSAATFEVGEFGLRPSVPDRIDKIVCSLVLHQVPIGEKRRLIEAMFHQLRIGGQLFIADYGVQPTWAMRLAFRMTVQMLDGTTDTRPNTEGVLPLLMGEAGFEAIRVVEHFDTATGRIEIIRAQRPASPGPAQ